MSAKVIVQTNPFYPDRQEFETESSKISDIIKKIDPAQTVQTGWRVMVNDEIITDFAREINDGDRIYIKVVPEGGAAGDPKKAGKGMMWAGAAMTVVGGIMMFTPAAGLGAVLVGAGIGILAGGVALYNLDIPKFDAGKLNQDREAPEQDPSIRGSKNQARERGYVPALFGERRIYADLGTQSYTWVEGGVQYLYQLFCAGQKEQEIDTSTIKIDETLLQEYSDSGDINKVLSGTDNLIQMQIAYGESVPPIVNKCVHEYQMNKILAHLTDNGLDASIKQTTVDDTEEIHVDILFNSGLGHYNAGGGIDTAVVDVKAEYKPADAPDTDYQPLGYFTGEGTRIAAARLKTLRYSVHKTGLVPGKYTVRITRMSADSTDPNTIDAVYVGSIRAIKNKSPIVPERCRMLTLIGLKVRVSEKLNGTISQLNFISKSILPIPATEGLSAEDWNKRELSANPASCAIWAMQSEFAQQKIEDSKIDWPAFAKLYRWCEEHNYECNAYLSESMTIQQLLSAIASTCRAEIFRLNGVITVVQDIARDSFVQIFTPRNSWDYEETLSFNDVPDALSVNFPNKDAGYTIDEALVYNTPDGNKLKEPEDITDVETWGITNSRQARMIGMYKYAVTKNRPIVHSFKCDVEYMLCTKGDWIKYAGDIALAGIKQGRIVQVLTDPAGGITGFVSDETLPMEENKEYAVRIRRNDASFAQVSVRNTPGQNTTVLFFDIYPENSLQDGNLFIFGHPESDSVDLVITDITCEDQLSATMTCVEYAPEIFGVDNPDFILPEFHSNISDISQNIDGGTGDFQSWQTFYTYNDSETMPEMPTGDGTNGDWHRIFTQKSKWQSSKTAENINSGAWSAPVPTSGRQIQDMIQGTSEAVGNPGTVPGLAAIALKDGIEISCGELGVGLNNVIRSITFEIKKKDSEEWISFVSSEKNYTYLFDRDNDGYPEHEDLQSWKVRAKAKNVYNLESKEYAECNVSVKNYGTWLVTTPDHYVRVSDRTITIVLSESTRGDGRSVYGNIRYGIQVKCSAQGDEGFYKPNIEADPFEDELNYKVIDDKGFVTTEGVYVQTMPLKGQDSSDITDTSYTFKIWAMNEVGKSEAVTVSATALCTSIRDLVKANETAKEAYISQLSALSANVGTITQGAFGNSNNTWDLSTFKDDNGNQHYEGLFHVGGSEQYLHVDPILINGQPTGEYTISFKVGAFEISANSSNINGELIIQYDDKSLDRTRITQTGTFYEHRETVGSTWKEIASDTVNGVKTQQVFSEHNLVITNQTVTERRLAGTDIGNPYLSTKAKVYHFDENFLDQNCNSELLIEGAAILAGEESNGTIDFTPAILAISPYSTVCKSAYGQFSASYKVPTSKTWTVDFWTQYIYAENQILFNIGNDFDRIKMIVQAAEAFYNDILSSDTTENDNFFYSYELAESQLFSLLETDPVFYNNDENLLYNNKSEKEPYYNKKAKKNWQKEYIFFVTNEDDIFVSIEVSVFEYDDMVMQGLYEQDCVYNETEEADSYLSHEGINGKESISIKDLGINLKNNMWVHVGIVSTETNIAVYFNYVSKTFAKYSYADIDNYVVLNEGKTSFILDELYIDNDVAEEFAIFTEHTTNRIPWGALDKNNQHFIFEYNQNSRLITNIFDSDNYRSKVEELLKSDLFKNRVLEIINKE